MSAEVEEHSEDVNGLGQMGCLEKPSGLKEQGEPIAGNVLGFKVV
jgi:hypothetical protein